MEAPLSEELIAMLVCPVSGRPLRLASDAELAEWWADEPLEGALVTEDGERAYPLRGGLPVLVPEAALARRKAGGA